MKVAALHVTPAAEADIDEHALFLAETSLDAGLRFYEAVEATLNQICSMPEIGSPNRLPYIEMEVRVWPVQDFPNVLMFYHESPHGIEIWRVLHGRRNWPQLVR